MSRAEIMEFQTVNPHPTKLTSVRSTDRLHDTPVWFCMDGSDQVETFSMRSQVPGEFPGRLKINHWVGQANIAD